MKMQVIGLLLLVSSASAENKKYVESLNDGLGKDAQYLVVALGQPTSDSVSGPIRRLVWDQKPRTGTTDSSPEKAETISRGRINEYGRYRGTSTTIVTPAKPAIAYVIADQIRFLLDAGGHAYRWEFYDWITTLDAYATAKPQWLLEDARELKRTKRGKPKIITPDKYHGIPEY